MGIADMAGARRDGNICLADEVGALSRAKQSPRSKMDKHGGTFGGITR